MISAKIVASEKFSIKNDEERMVPRESKKISQSVYGFDNHGFYRLPPLNYLTDNSEIPKMKRQFWTKLLLTWKAEEEGGRKGRSSQRTSRENLFLLLCLLLLQHGNHGCFAAADLVYHQV